MSAAAEISRLRLALVAERNRADHALKSARVLERAREVELAKLATAEAVCDRLRLAIEAMRVAGGSAEFQVAFDLAKALIAEPGSEP